MSAGSVLGLPQASSLDRSSPSSSTSSALLNRSLKWNPFPLSASDSVSPGLMSSTNVVKKRGKGRPPGSKNLPKPLPGAPPPPKKKRGRPKKSVPLGPDGQPIASPPRRARGRPRRDPSSLQSPKRSRVRARPSVPVLSPVVDESGAFGVDMNINTRIMTEEIGQKEVRMTSDGSTAGWNSVDIQMAVNSTGGMPTYELDSQTVKVGESGTTTGSLYQLANQPNSESIPLAQPIDSFEAFEFPDFPFSFDFPAFLQEIQQYRRIQDDHERTGDVEGEPGHSLVSPHNPSSHPLCSSSSSSTVPPASLPSPNPLPASSHTQSLPENQTQQEQAEPTIRTRHRLSPEPPMMSEIEPIPLADSFAFDMPAFLLEIQQYHRDHFQVKDDDAGDGDERW
ncbi:AT hook-like [Phaffia rhodozyma]|uniref:AT hook-like n=1 Tax=Phaffia rhodozyma TaxID=264483 RepID=A0A0F7SPR1_PHARH|nr:AT hook-like [Phaffia rhodozyma]